MTPRYQQIGYIEPIRPNSQRKGEHERSMREEEMRHNEEAERQRIALETARNTERLKSAKWTRDDLVKLVYEQEKILDNHFGEPQTFEDDLSLINAQIAKEKGEIKLDGIEKEKISSDGIDYLYGLVLQEHIIKQNFYIEIGTNYQPIIHDNTNNPDAKRIEQKEGLQKALTALEFQHDSNNPLRKNDNTSKIAIYITAAAYHGQKEKNLIKYREDLEKRIQKNPNEPLTAEEIKASDLAAGQKSFLLAWKERNNDENLLKIQENQKKFVEQARENYKKKSPEQHLQELSQRPIGKSIELFGAGVIGIGLLAFGLKQMFGEKSGIMGKIFGTIMALIGGAIALPMADKTWQALGGPEMVNGLTTKRPVDRKKANDHPFANLGENIEDQWMTLSGKVEKLQARISGPKEWLGMITRPELKPIMRDYPVGSTLYVLYDGYPSEQKKYEAFKPDDALNTKIQETLATIKTLGEREVLKKLLLTSWERFGEINPGILGDTEMAKGLTLPGIIDSIDMADSWLNYIPEWMGGGTDKKVDVLKVIAPKANDWGELTLYELDKYFTQKIPNSRIKKLLSSDTTKAEQQKETMKNYLSTIDMTKNGAKKLRDFLQSA